MLIMTKKLTTQSAFDYMQRHLKCCGVDSSSDWNTKNSTFPHHQIPTSCCVHDTGTDCSQYEKNIFKKGCYTQVLENFHRILRYITGIVISFAVFQLIGIMMSAYLIVVLKKNGYIRMVDHANRTGR